MERESAPTLPHVDVDAFLAEAEALIARSANDMRTLTERLRSRYADAVRLADAGSQNGRAPDRTPLSQARALLSRLELISRDFDDDWRFLERGVYAATWSDTGRAFVDDPGLHEAGGRRMAKRILEAQEQERIRLAEEIHDGPAQVLTNATFQTEIIARLIERDVASAQVELRRMRVGLDRELRRMRAYIHELRPMLDDAGSLTSGIAEAAEGLTHDTGTPVELRLQAPEEPLDLDGRTAVLRVTQEALRNAGKHAKASRVTIATRIVPGATPESPGTWTLEIVDDGAGFSVGQVLERSDRHHFGLRFMRERAELVGASLDVASTPGVGTTIRMQLPIAERSDEG